MRGSAGLTVGAVKLGRGWIGLQGDQGASRTDLGYVGPNVNQVSFFLFLNKKSLAQKLTEGKTYKGAV